MALTQVDQGLLGATAQYTGFKNRIINGDMRVAQRGTSGTVGTGSASWTLDRWQHRPSNSVGGTTTWAQAFDAATGVTKIRLNYSGATSSAYIQQKFEAQYVNDLWGAPVTLTFFSSDSAVTVSVYSYDATGTEGTVQNNVTPTSLGGNKYQLTFTLTTPAGGIRQGVEMGLLIAISMRGGATPANSTNYDYWNIQLEKGSSATSFDYRPYGTELVLCQRYFQSFKRAGEDSNPGWLATSYNANNIYMPVQFFTPMRRVPDVLSGGSWRTRQSNLNIFTANFGYQQSGLVGCILAQTASTNAANSVFWVEPDGSYSTAYLAFNGEM